jgi:hypothetical protein
MNLIQTNAVKFVRNSFEELPFHHYASFCSQLAGSINWNLNNDHSRGPRAVKWLEILGSIPAL